MLYGCALDDRLPEAEAEEMPYESDIIGGRCHCPHLSELMGYGTMEN